MNMSAIASPLANECLPSLDDAARMFLSSGAEPRKDLPWDAGKIVLGSASGIQADELQDLCSHWLSGFPENPGLFSLYAGNGGLVFGLRHACSRLPDLAHVYRRIRNEVLEVSRQELWSVPARDWQDYDLVTGPSGLLLACLGDPDVDDGALVHLAGHLADLVTSADLEAFRLEGARDDPQRGWNHREINLGPAHGVAGVLAALAAYIRRFPSDTHARTALENGLDWFVLKSHKDARGLLTWAPGARSAERTRAASRREAWCYGAPASAFIVWDAADALGRADLKEFACEVFRTFLGRFDPDFHLDDDPDEKLAICHGAAGLMLIADCFETHAGLGEAAALKWRMRDLIVEDQASLASWMRRNATLLSGASGVLLALDVIEGGSRSWLPALGLR
ncbi:MAG: hypothetical protein Tsb0019_22000 [Roseibium sp.]